MEELTVKQNKVARLIQKDITVVSSPFTEIGNACGLTAKEVLGTTKELLKKVSSVNFAPYCAIKKLDTRKML